MLKAAKTFAAAVASLLLLAPAAAQAKWLRAESTHFVVYSNSGEGDLRSYVQTLENFDRVLRRLHNNPVTAPNSPKLPIYMVNGLSDLRQVFPQMSSTIAGVYTASSDDTFAVAFKPSDAYGDFIIKHEYYHYFMLAYFPGAYPGWLVEGYAEFYSTAQPYAGKVWIGGATPGQVQELNEEAWIPLDQLISKSAFDVGYRMPTYYAEAWLLTNYMQTNVERARQLNAYVDAVRAGEDSVKAWTAAVGETPAETQKKLRLYLAGGRLIGRVLPVEEVSKADVAITPMPASTDDMLLEGQQLKTNVPADRRAALLAQVRADAAKHPGDRLADLVLARAEITIGDLAAADPVLARRLKADPDDQEARLLLALARMKAGDADPARRTELYREADKALVPAVKANQDDYRILYAYARSRSVEPGYPSENMMGVLLRAVERGPQVANVRLAAADGFAQRGDYADALILLQPVANDPHDTSIGRIARQRMDAIRDLQAKPKVANPGG